MLKVGLLDIEDCLDAQGGIAIPPDVNLISLIERNIANVGDAVAYRYLDFGQAADGQAVELTWTELGLRLEAVAAQIQSAAGAGERVAVLAPQGLDFVVSFFAALKAGCIAVPLFAPELQGHAERLETALLDARPSVVLTTSAVRDVVEAFLATVRLTQRPRVLVVDRIPDAAAAEFRAVVLDVDGVSHLQYTSGATRAPVGVELTHRAVGTNLIQMILAIDLLDRNTHGVSWLPLYHDMGLSMIGFPAVYGGHSTLMSPTAFLRRPERWIGALSDESRSGRAVTAAPNFAYEWTAQRGRPPVGSDVDLSNVVMIVGSEPVSMTAVEAFNAAFAPFGLPPTAIKPSYGIADATLFVSTIAPHARAKEVFFDREALTRGRAVLVAAGAPGAVSHVSCGQLARSSWGVIVEPERGAELTDGEVGEVWLHGANVGRGYWGKPEQTRRTFGAVLRSRLDESHAAGVPEDAAWLRTGDLGVYVDGELYITGRMADIVSIAGRDHYPQDIEATVADASALVRKGYVAAFAVDQRLVIIAERATGSKGIASHTASTAIAAAVQRRHGLIDPEVLLVKAGQIPRTTSGKLARVACRAEYLDGCYGAG